MAQNARNVMNQVRIIHDNNLKFQECQEFIPDFKLLIEKLSHFELQMYSSNSSLDEFDYGKIFVNRIFYSWISLFYANRFRHQYGFSTDRDKLFLYELENAILPPQHIMLSEIFATMTHTVQCYKTFAENILRIPLVELQPQVSSSRYNTAHAITYTHVYIPFEYEHIPHPEVLTALLVLVKERKAIFRDSSNHLQTAVNFLLLNEVESSELRVTDLNGNLKTLFTRLTDNVFLRRMPDCTPEQFVRSVDSLPTEAIPEIQGLKTFESETPHYVTSRFDTIPTRDWFTEQSLKPDAFDTYHTEIKFIETQPHASQAFVPIIEKQNKTNRTTPHDEEFLNSAHTAEFWLNTFTQP